MRKLSVFLAALAAVSLAHADTFIKADNTSALNLPASWVNNAVPTNTDIARWDHTVSAANAAATLGGNMAVGGLSILDPGDTITIAAGNTLTNGAFGIDMSSATADLTLNNTIFIAPGALQQWNVAPGHTLTVAAIPTKPGHAVNNTGALQVGTTGTVKFGVTAVPLIIDEQNNPWVTYGLNDWAAIDATGTVIPASYTPAATAFTGGVNNDVQGSFANGTTSIDVSSLRFDSATPCDVSVSTSGTSRTLTARGILITSNSGGGSLGGTTTSSFVRPSRGAAGASANTSFNIIQNSAADFTISANLSDASSSTPVHIVKSGPGNLILANAGNGFSGGLDINGGTVTAAAGAKLGGGASAVNVNNNARLVLNASNTTVIGSATINASATNSIKVNTANGQQYIPAVTFNGNATHFEVNYANGIAASATTAPLIASNLTVNSSVTVDVYNNNLAVGIYPLIHYTNAFSGAGSLTLGALPSRVTGYLSNDTTAAAIDLVVTNVNQPIHWAVGDADWDINNSANWKDTFGNTVKYQETTTPYSALGDSVVLDDSASGSSPITINLTANVSPAGIAATGTKSYTISGSGTINGTGGIIKSGSGTLTLATPNSFTGGINLNGGFVAFTALTNLSGGAITFNGGGLRYTNSDTEDISVLPITFGAGGATIDDGGSFVGLNNPIGNGGPGNFTKIGAGTLLLSGTNKYTGNTIVSAGTLEFAQNTYISNSPALIVNATLDVGSLGGSLTLSPAVNQVLSGTGFVTGNVTVPTGTTLSPATNGVVGTFNLNNDLTVSGGTLAFDVSSSSSHDLLNVLGNLTINSGSLLVITNTTPLPNGVYKLIQYSGGLLNGPGSSGNLIVQGFNQPGKIAALSDATPNEIDLVVSTLGGASTTWTGNDATSPGLWDVETTKNFANSAHTPVTFVNGDKPTFDDSSTVPNVNLAASVQPGSVTINATNNSYTFQDISGTGSGKISGPGGITKNGPSTLTILTLNNNSGATVINGGTVQVGNGSQNGDIGTGNITDNGALVFQQTDNRSVAGAISGTGSLTQQGAGTLTLAQDNSYTGPTTISSGGLQVGTGAAAGSISPADVVDNGTLSFNRSGALTVPNNISGSGAFATLGSSAINFSGALTYLGNTFISNGLVQLTAPNQIPNGSNVVGSTGWLILDGSATHAGTLDLNGFNQTVNALSGLGGTFTGVITNSGTSTTTTNVLTVLGAAGTTYNGIIADNASGAKTMLVLRGATELRLNGNNTYSGGTIVGDSATIGFGPGASVGSGTLTMSNGTTLSMHNAGSTLAFAGANVVIPDNATFTNFTTSTGNGFAGTITGSETTTNILMATSGQSYSISSTTKQLQPFLGTLLIPADQTLRWSGSSGLNNGGDFVTLDLEGSMSSKNPGTVSFGALTGAGTFASPGSGTVTWIIGKNNDSTFPGTISDTPPAHNALTKVGTGTLSLTGSANYSGATTVSNGVLALATDSATLDNSPSITLAGDNATIDVTGHSDPTFYLGNVTPQVLNGFGVINGNLFEQVNTTNNLRPGVLRVTQTATINGALNMQINRTNAVNSAELSAPTFVNGGSIILTVTNVGSTNLAGGDKFQLFNQAFTGDLLATNLPALPVAGMYWTNNIAVDGSISVVSTVATNPTNITTSVSGGVLTLTWPADHQGWTLQQNTNLVTPTWQDVPGSTSMTTTNVTIDPTVPSIYYRLKLN